MARFSDSTRLFYLCGNRHVVTSLIKLTLGPVPCPAARFRLLSRFTLCYFRAFVKLRGAPVLWWPPVTACGVSFPFDKIQKSLLPFSPRCRCVQRSHRPVTLFGKFVFSNALYRVYEARRSDRSSPNVLHRGRHAVVTLQVMQLVATLLVHAVS